jgi:hypothetical protein
MLDPFQGVQSGINFDRLPYPFARSLETRVGWTPTRWTASAGNLFLRSVQRRMTTVENLSRIRANAICCCDQEPARMARHRMVRFILR